MACGLCMSYMTAVSKDEVKEGDRWHSLEHTYKKKRKDKER